MWSPIYVHHYARKGYLWLIKLAKLLQKKNETLIGEDAVNVTKSCI